MTNTVKAKLSAVAGLVVGSFGLATSVRSGNVWVAASCGVVYGMTISLVAVSLAVMRKRERDRE